MDGFAALGQVLGGGNRQRQNAAYDEGFLTTARAGHALEQARHERARRMAQEMINTNRGGITGDLVTRVLGGDQTALGELGALQLGMASDQPDFRKFTGGLGDLTSRQLDTEIADALAAGDTTTARNLSAVKNDKVLPELGASGNLVFTPTSGDVSLTPLGNSSIAVDRATINQRNAAAGASSAQARATLGRLAIAQGQYDAQRRGEWDPSGANRGTSGPSGQKAPSGYRWTASGALEAIPGGPADKGQAELGAASGISASFNPRQRAGSAMQKEAVLNQVATQTDTPRAEVNRILETEGPQGVANLMQRRGGRLFQGPILGRIPWLSEVLNSDVTPYGEGAARGQAMINDPAGPITNPDVEGARAMVPSYRQPIAVQANLVESLLRAGGATAPSQGLPNYPTPNDRQIQALINNPGLSAQFDAKFGDGAAAAYLGQ